MSLPNISKRRPSKLHYGVAAIIAIAGISALAVILYWKTPEGQDAPTALAPRSATGVFGPGVMNGDGKNTSLAAHEEIALPAVPGSLRVDANQRLVIDSGFLEIINFFLLEQANSEQSNALQSYLKAKLPAAAFNEARAIVAHYQVYMKAHDDLLQGQNFAADNTTAHSRNIERLMTWREQRDRLRLNVLGDAVVHAWYQNEDAEFNQVLAELQLRNQSAASGVESVNDEQHEQDIQLVLTRATKSFKTLAQEGRQWAIHLATYQAAVIRINQQTELNSLERANQIQQLSIDIFPTEEERQRARDMNP